MLSLDLAQHPNIQYMASELVWAWKRSGQADKTARLHSGDISDLVPMIAQIEREHRAWVAEDPHNRHFGPPSPFALKAEKEVGQALELMAEASVDMNDLVRRIKAGEVSPDDFAKLVAETIVSKKG